MEMTEWWHGDANAIDRFSFITCISWENRACYIMQGHIKSHWVWSGGRNRSKEEAELKTSTGVSVEMQGRAYSLGLASLNNFFWLWALVDWCLVPEWLRAGYRTLTCVLKLGKKFLGVIDPALIGLHAKDLLIDISLLSLGIR